MLYETWQREIRVVCFVGNEADMLDCISRRGVSESDEYVNALIMNGTSRMDTKVNTFSISESW